MPCAVSGRRYTVDPSSFTGPTVVSNIRLKSRASVRSQSGSRPGAWTACARRPTSSRWSARKRSLQVRQSTSGSVKPARWPLAFQVVRVLDDRRVERHDVVALLQQRPPPLVLDVVLEQHPVVAVVVARADPPVDLAALEYEAAPLAQRDDLVHGHDVAGHGAGLPGGHGGALSGRRVGGHRVVDGSRRSVLARADRSLRPRSTLGTPPGRVPSSGLYSLKRCRPTSTGARRATRST